MHAKTTAALALATFLIALALTGVMRRFATALSLIDAPNARSSHLTPTPRGGGVAIVAASTVSFLALAGIGALPARLTLALVLAGLAVAIVGLLDDRYELSAGVRIIVHFAAAFAAVYWLGGMPPLQFGSRIVEFGVSGYVLGTLTLVWVVNLFNFMDGIDGIAGSEAAFVSLSAAALAAVSGNWGAAAAAAVMLGMASGGFLVWNWAPARIFMGDVGSGFLGFCLGVLALAAGRDSAAAPLVWLILGGAFVVDATITLGMRILRGRRIYEAHRNHAYQWLARRLGSHGLATAAVIVVNACWLLPLAVWATWHPDFAGLLALAALGPLAIWIAALDVERRERSPDH